MKSKEETESTGRTVDGINPLLEMFPALELSENTLLLISAGIALPESYNAQLKL